MSAAIKNREKLAEAIKICRAIWADLPAFDRQEREYKLKIAERMRAALQAVSTGDDFLPLLKRAFGGQNNLTDYRVHGRFLRWAEANLENAAAALRVFTLPAADASTRVDNFIERIDPNVLSGEGALLSISSFFLFGLDPAQFPIYRSTPLEIAEQLLGYPAPLPMSSAGEDYAHHSSFLREFAAELTSAGIPLRDTLDAQSLIFTLAKNDRPDFAAWRGERPSYTTRGEEREKMEVEMTAQLDSLRSLVERFRAEDGYPTREDDTDLRARQEFEDYLDAQLEAEEPAWRMLQRIISSGVYGSPGPQSGLNRYINNAGEDESKRLQETLRYLLQGDEPLAERLDRVLDGDYKIPGLGESGAMKLLSIMRPADIVPVFPFRGAKGKAMLMADPALGLAPPTTGSRGELAARSNEMLVEKLSPYFGEDAHGMKRFLYWLAYRTPGAPEEEDEGEALARLADGISLDPAFLADVIEMLRERKQLILYGPPGTGKTYVARALMEHLAPSPTRYKVVQFHPSYSYEDFVQGYRPLASDSGQLGYRLKGGPLMRLAEDAAADPTHEYVLLIDEINRGNLPKIFGELLYLLEYRESAVSLMYGEEGDEFSLPPNLLIIGTMNTADRSIALVDAALRRRFHFVPLFPGEGPLTGFLDRWLSRHQPGMAYVAGVVDALNRELKDLLGPHVQVGHSYFTRKDLSDKILRRVWANDVKPLLEDQLFGQEQELERFTLEALGGAADANDRAARASADDA